MSTTASPDHIDLRQQVLSQLARLLLHGHGFRRLQGDYPQRRDYRIRLFDELDLRQR